MVGSSAARVACAWPTLASSIYVGSDASRRARPSREVRDGAWGPRGDMLVFLPGERDIRELAHALRGEAGLDVLPLYARLGQAEQARVFDPRSRRGLRVVLATNVAETSVTVPGIRYVIDPGEARINRYSPRSRIQRLPIEPVSRASADQRKGRCGRVGPGVCLRLYSEEDYLSRPAFTDPEIRRSSLAAVILQMLDLRLGAVERFPFLEPPERKGVREGRAWQRVRAAAGHEPVTSTLRAPSKRSDAVSDEMICAIRRLRLVYVGRSMSRLRRQMS